MPIYEFEIINHQTQKKTYRVIEKNTLEKAEAILEKDASIDQEHSTYELHQAILPNQYDALVRLAKKRQDRLQHLYDAKTIDLLKSDIAVFRKDHAITQDKESKVIRVYPTLDATFERKKK